MKNKGIKLVGLLASGLLAMSLLVGCGDKEKNTLTMGTNAEFPPFEYHEGEEGIVGFDIDLAHEIADKLGKELVIEDMDFDGLLTALSADKVDFVAAGVTATEERRTQVDFTKGYFHTKQSIIVKADNEAIQEADDLLDKKVGVQLGTTGDIYADMAGIEGLIQFTTGPLAVLDLKNGKIDAVIIDEIVAHKMIEGQSDLKILEVPFIEEEYAIAIKKGNEPLLKEINKALEELKADGTYDTLYKKYFQEEK